jgi:hypothetical protein
MLIKRDELYSNVCTAVLQYGDFVKDSYKRLPNADSADIEKIAREISDKYHETMLVIEKYVDYRLKEQSDD